jgi:DNA helicase-2/ATP-dependent DNA helicase PcrA
MAVFGGAGSHKRRKRRKKSQPIEEARFEAKFVDGAEAAFKKGERVFHQKFGYGRIIAVDGGKLEISFEKAGSKKVMASFVETV